MSFYHRWVSAVAALALLPAAASGCHRHHELDEAEVREHAHDVAEMVIDRVDGSPEQQARIEQILDPLVPDLLALRPERQALIAELREALGAERVDPARIEELRKKALSLADRASLRASQALVEASQVLDHAQRTKLIEHWRRRTGS